MAERGDRTLAPTARRLQKAREEGSVPISRELNGLAGLGAATLLLTMAGPALGHVFAARLRDMLLAPEAGMAAALAEAGVAALALAGPVVGAVLLATVASVLLQTGFLLRPAALMPDLARLDPRRGLKRLFGLAGLFESAKSVVKLAVLGFAVWKALGHAWPGLAHAPFWEPGQLLDRTMRAVARLMLTLVGAQALIALADVGWARFRHARDLRMSRQDVREETREADGDPAIKARVRRLRLARAKKRMLAAVPKATVVVTNPTHYAVALSYDRGRQAAPRVVAKGVDEVAARIRETAQAHGVPLVASPPLARALFTVDLDSEVPVEHFKAVAEIIAYVWRLRSRAGPAAAR